MEAKRKLSFRRGLPKAALRETFGSRCCDLKYLLKRKEANQCIQSFN